MQLACVGVNGESGVGVGSRDRDWCTLHSRLCKLETLCFFLRQTHLLGVSTSKLPYCRAPIPAPLLHADVGIPDSSRRIPSRFPALARSAVDVTSHRRCAGIQVRSQPVRA